MPGPPEEERRTEQVAQTPEQQAAKQGAEQLRNADAARVQEEAAEELAHLVHHLEDDESRRWPPGRAPQERMPAWAKSEYLCYILTRRLVQYRMG